MDMWIEHAYRALKPSWFEAEQLTNKAYRRSLRDTDGLSVACSHENAKMALERGQGVAAIELRFFESVGLRIVFTAEEPHGTIDGLPPAEAIGEEFDRALELADRLVDASAVTIDSWRRAK